MNKNPGFVLKELEQRGFLEEFFENWIRKELPMKGHYGNMRVLFGLSSIYKLAPKELALVFVRKLKVSLFIKCKKKKKSEILVNLMKTLVSITSKIVKTREIEESFSDDDSQVFIK